MLPRTTPLHRSYSLTDIVERADFASDASPTTNSLGGSAAPTDTDCVLLKNVVLKGSVEDLARLFDERGVSPHAADDFALRHGVATNNERVVDLVLNHRDACPERISDSAVSRAFETSNRTIIDKIVACARMNAEVLGRAFRWSIWKNVPDVFERLVDDPRVDFAATDPNDDDALYAAVIKRRVGMLAKLSGHARVDPAARGNRAIEYAATMGYLDVVDILLRDPRVDPSASDNKSVVEAAWRNNFHVVERLLQDPRVDPNARDYAVLCAAALHSEYDVLFRILDHPRLDTRLPRDYLASIARDKDALKFTYTLRYQASYSSSSSGSSSDPSSDDGSSDLYSDDGSGSSSDSSSDDGAVVGGGIDPVLQDDVKYKNECPICMDETNASTRVYPPCGHMYHQPCLAQYTGRRNRACAICRLDMTRPIE